MSAPWMKFYPSDWRSDPALRVCSLAARGLWIEMLCVMHEATPRGTLRINGTPMNSKQIAALVGTTNREVQIRLDELEMAGVFSRHENVIYSRRMVRDTEKAERDKANGEGGGNPRLKGGVNPRVKAQKPDTRSQIREPPPSEAPPNKPDTTIAVEIYNATATECGWPLCQRLTKQRLGALTARLAECGGLDGWRAAMARAAASSFLRGDNPKGWRPDFDFFCQSKSFTKLMEGSYDDRKPSPANGSANGPHDTVLRSIARVVEKRAREREQPPGADAGIPALGSPAPSAPVMEDFPDIPAALQRH